MVPRMMAMAMPIRSELEDFFMFTLNDTRRRGAGQSCEAPSVTWITIL
jgi:hypothetical protein